MLYPLLFDSIYHERIWGGNMLKNLYKRQIPGKNAGEVWEISCNINGTNRIRNGALNGLSLETAIREYGPLLLGTKCMEAYNGRLPLLIKLLDTADTLSVQVHPGDMYAAKYEKGQMGKTEAWYVIWAKPDAKIIYGLKPGADKKVIKAAVDKGCLEKYLNYLKVKAGDFIYIPAGMVHALGDGLVVYEIQQNSDLTYRLYDWNRRDARGYRELHVEKAIDVIDYRADGLSTDVHHSVTEYTGVKRTYYPAGPYFTVEKLEINSEVFEKTNTEKFIIITSIHGNGSIIYDSGEVSFHSGDSVLIPASLGLYRISGCCTILKAYVP